MPLHLIVVTAERTVLDRTDVQRVIVPTTEGQITLLPMHAPLMASLAIGELVAVTPSGSEAMAVHGGFVQIVKDTVTILADAAERAEDIDEERAEAARVRAQRRLAGERISPEEGQGQINVLRARLSMERALVRVKVRRRRRGTGAPAMSDRA